MAKHKAVVVAISEGVSLDGDAESAYQSGETDCFGHKYLSGVGKALEQIVRNEIGCKVRSIELNVMQRCSSHICSKTDITEAEQIGAAGVRCALKGETGTVMVFRRVRNMPYTIAIESASASKIANQERYLPASFLNAQQNNITDEALQYFLPLIQGEVQIQMENGLPKHFTVQEAILK